MSEATLATAPRIHSSIVDATELPRIIRVKDNLYAAAFTLMKLLPARFIIDRAEATGQLAPGAPVIETSSGTFGLGLALVCRLRNHPLTIVGDHAIDAELKDRLERLGATVEIIEERGHPGGIQGARLDRVHELHAQSPESFVPGQYDNPDNGLSYGAVGDLVAHTLGPVDCLFGPVGSGGSTGGLAAALRTRNADLRLAGIDTQGSIIFGLPNGKRTLRGLGSSIHPGNVDYTAYDEVHWINAAEAFHATHRLYRDHGLFMGPTSGASFLAASWWADRHPDRTTLMILPDEGYRYQPTVYNDTWLAEQNIVPVPCPDGPTTVNHPSMAGSSWTRLEWARRSYAAATAPDEKDAR
ncbi:PLP-dependent cysteine synthase family protein [Streptomyces sp. NPDC051561]|uniref:PLP-dependent cysteine synthase family protein n=1 Tax=Streptomyces sp. NPDC051561 TaxID=3365658 RepID=UPI00378FC414